MRKIRLPNTLPAVGPPGMRSCPVSLTTRMRSRPCIQSDTSLAAAPSHFDALDRAVQPVGQTLDPFEEAVSRSALRAMLNRC